MLRNDNKVFAAAPSSVGFDATFSPREKAFAGCSVVYTKGIHNVPSGGARSVHLLKRRKRR